MQQMQAKKKRFDMLTPDKDDDDCQVICMQPKNTDGGLPQIESVQVSEKIVCINWVDIN